MCTPVSIRRVQTSNRLATTSLPLGPGIAGISGPPERKYEIARRSPAQRSGRRRSRWSLSQIQQRVPRVVDLTLAGTSGHAHQRLADDRIDAMQDFDDLL